MPLSKYYGGHGEEVMANMKREYGSKKGERVFYATANKRKQGECRTCMGRTVIHHSPDKHPEQDDPMSSYTIFQQDMAKPPMRQPGLKMGKSYTSPREADKAIEELRRANPGSVIYKRKGGKA